MHFPMCRETCHYISLPELRLSGIVCARAYAVMLKGRRGVSAMIAAALRKIAIDNIF